MLGRPSAILALHINRSVHTGLRVAKNGTRVAFPELLDLAPYTTGGVLNLEPTAALSGSGADAHASGHGNGDACLYRLAAAVCHYGQHSFGHYICYRRAPVASASSYAPAPPSREGSAGTGRRWLRISDARVDRCGLEQVLAEGGAVFMLYYERVPAPPPVYAGALAEADSAETLKPGMAASMSVGGSGLRGSGLWGAGTDGAKARVSSSSLSSSSLSLRSVSSTPAPATPRAQPADEASGQVEEGLALSPSADDENANANAEEEGAALPAPPLTPRADSEPPVAAPSKAQKARTKAKKKKKGKQEQAA
ncbi:hypothetical protein B0H11DRAFT_489669 [Mycena galericulata]|nr:hypothetical protein B0H11DRAFT_489669 [Mycena galericulata]